MTMDNEKKREKFIGEKKTKTVNAKYWRHFNHILPSEPTQKKRNENKMRKIKVKSRETNCDECRLEVYTLQKAFQNTFKLLRSTGS